MREVYEVGWGDLGALIERGDGGLALLGFMRVVGGFIWWVSGTCEGGSNGGFGCFAWGWRVLFFGALQVLARAMLMAGFLCIRTWTAVFFWDL